MRKCRLEGMKVIRGKPYIRCGYDGSIRRCRGPLCPHFRKTTWWTLKARREIRAIEREIARRRKNQEKEARDWEKIRERDRRDEQLRKILAEEALR